MLNLIRAGVFGAIAGASLGASQRGKSGFTRLKFYEPIPLRMAPNESLDAWWVWISHLKGGRGAGSLGQSLSSQWSSSKDETAFGLANIAFGLGSPMAGSLRNPLANGSQAFGRAVFWGLAFHGQPDKAAEWAYADASLDHSGDGAWLPAFCARLLAGAQPGVAPAELISASLSLLPPSSSFVKVYPYLQGFANHPDGPREARIGLNKVITDVDELSAAYTMAAIAMGLLAGKGDMGRSLLATAGFGAAADQASMVTGAISAILAGDAAKEWMEPLGTTYVASHALRGIDAPATFDDLANWVGQAWQALQPPTPVIPEPVPAPAPVPEPTEPPSLPAPSDVTDTTDTETTDLLVAEPVDLVPAPAPVEVTDTPLMVHLLPPSPELIALLAAEPNNSVQESGGLRVTFQHIDPPIIGPGQALRLAITFRNLGTEERQLDPQLTPPDGWKIASRMTGFRLPAGDSATFPVVLQSPADFVQNGLFLRVKVNMLEFRDAIFPAERWYWTGPFVNHEGTGFDRVYPAETVHNLSQTFNGRSDLPVKWEQSWEKGVQFDLEPHFKSGPGAVILWSKVRLPHTGRHTLVIASPVGAVAWVDGKKVLWYHDEHDPIPRAKDPYMGSFETAGESTVVIKILRNRKPLGPTTIYFLTADGQVVYPTHWQPMDA